MQNSHIRSIVLKKLLMEIVEQNLYLQSSQLSKQTYRICIPNMQKIWEQIDTSRISVEEINEIKKQIGIFCKHILQAPTQWFEALLNDRIMTDDENIRINRSSTITKIYQDIIDNVDKEIGKWQWQMKEKYEENLKKVKSIYQDQQTESVKSQNFETDISDISIESNNQSFIKQGNPMKDQKKLTQQKSYFESVYIDQTIKSLISQVLNSFAYIIAHTFTQGKYILLEEADKIDQQIKTCEIMNTYFLFALLKQMTSKTQKIILQNLSRTFPEIPPKKIKEFCNYIQKNYQYVSLYAKFDSEVKILNQIQLDRVVNFLNEKWLKYVEDCEQDQSVTLKKIESVDGQEGILVIKRVPTALTKKQMEAKIKKQKEMQKKQQEEQRELQMKQKEKQDQEKRKSEQRKNKSKKKSKPLEFEKGEYPYIILRIEKGNQIRVTHVETCQKTWKVLETKYKVHGMYQALKNQIYSLPHKEDLYSYAIPTPESATIGGSLGKCLADINKYNNANEFLIDLSKATAISSCLSYAIVEIPILGYFIIAGAFTYSFYMTLTNQATSQSKKIKQIGGTAMTAVGSIGSIIGGIFLGQAIIPVPILGGFIGGVFGGFIGATGTRKLNSYMLKNDFRDMIVYLKHNIVEDQRWFCTKKLLQRIGINQQYFNQHIPFQQRDVYITALCFCLVAFYQSKRLIDRNARKSKQKQQQKNLQNLQQQQQQAAFVNEFNIVKIVDYLTQQNLQLLNEIQSLTKYISHVSS